MNSLSGAQYEITSAAHRAIVTEVGAGLRRYAVDGVDVTCTYGTDELPPKGCGTTLVPWPNRIRDGAYTFDGTSQQLGLTDPGTHNAIHGFGRWSRWTPVRQDPDAVTLALDVVPQKGYPFQLHAEVAYSLGGDGLTVALSARNDGTVRAPFGAGSHPYLSARGHPLDEVTLRLPATEQLVMDERQLPTGTRPLDGEEDFRSGRLLGARRFDSGFTGVEYADGRGSAELRTPSGGARLWFDDAFRYLQVFTVDDLTPGCSGVAIEPMTCAPDAFNSGAGLIVLEPGESWTASWGVAAL